MWDECNLVYQDEHVLWFHRRVYYSATHSPTIVFIIKMYWQNFPFVAVYIFASLYLYDMTFDKTSLDLYALNPWSLSSATLTRAISKPTATESGIGVKRMQNYGLNLLQKLVDVLRKHVRTSKQKSSGKTWVKLNNFLPSLVATDLLFSKGKVEKKISDRHWQKIKSLRIKK